MQVMSMLPLQSVPDSSQPGLPQKRDEWKNMDQAAYAYHLQQWTEQKQSTKRFADFIDDSLSEAQEVIDLGCGAGAATFCLAQKHPKTRIVGVDYSADLIALAGQLAVDKQMPNLQFETGDWFDLNRRSGIDGVVSLQTLSWLPGFEKPLEEIFEKLNPKWVALTSLFYEGDISCTIEVDEHSRKRRSFYNVYSIPAVMRHVGKFGYKVSRKLRFVIDIDIEKPANADHMATYTVPSKDSAGVFDERLQISGPLLMSWYFLLIEQT
jgi:ubiquinone/menaquinone biosynthesis C-methylase UbiE